MKRLTLFTRATKSATDAGYCWNDEEHGNTTLRSVYILAYMRGWIAAKRARKRKATSAAPAPAPRSPPR